MGTFTVHDEDGKITQSNTVFDHDGYDKILRNAGVTKFVFTSENRPLHHERFHVKGGQLAARPAQDIRISKNTIKAGGNDEAVIAGFLPGSVITITTGGIQIYKDMVPTTQIEISIPVPCIYDVLIEKWPYMAFSCKVKAVP